MNRTSQSYKQKIQVDENNLPYHYIDLISEESRLVWEIERRALMKQLKKLISPFNTQRILDAGCGDGRFCYEFSDEPVEVTGVDVSQRAIDFARVFNPRVKFRLAGLEKVPAELRPFDKIVCQEVLEHIPPDKVKFVLGTLDRLLKPKGKIVFTVPSTRLRVPMKHFQHFDRSSLNTTLSDYFIVEKIIGHNIVSYKRIIFLTGRYLSVALFPFRKKYRWIYTLYQILKNYYESNLAIGDPEDGLGLIAICCKKP